MKFIIYEQSCLSQVILCGGMESMSRAAHCANLRGKKKMGPLKITSENFENIKLDDSMMTDGLMCALTGQHMGNTAENIAKKFQISRQAQDDFAFASVQKVRNGCLKTRVRNRWLA